MPELEITTASRRYYMDEILKNKSNAGVLPSVADTFVRFNIMAEWMYNRMYDKEYKGIPYDGTLTSMVKAEYSRRWGGKLSDYYITSMNAVASGMFSSQKELQKVYNKEHKERQDNRRAKIKSLEEKLARYEAVKALFVARSRAAKAGTLFDDNAFREYGLSFTEKGDVLFPGKKHKMAALSPYLYECRLDGWIKSTKTSIALIKEKIRMADQKHTGIPKRATFGTRKQYKKKDTACATEAEREVWHQERDFRRFHSVRFSGRSTSRYGNYQCRYDTATGQASITLIDGKVLTLDDVKFPYRGAELTMRRIQKDHPYVAYALEWKKDTRGRDYFILKASFLVSNDHVNTCLADGCVAVDINYDHLAVADINKDGCLLETKVFKFHTEGKNSGKAASILGHAVKEFMDYTEPKHKPIVKERLDITKTSLEYGNRKANRRISMFAYKKIDSLIKGQALKRSIGVIEINPAYTSMLGKVKYMKAYGISIHCAAAYVIGRRGMGFTERLPSFLKRMYYHKRKDGTIINKGRGPWKSYADIYKHIKAAPMAFWFGDIRFKTWDTFDGLVGVYKKEHGYA